MSTQIQAEAERAAAIIADAVRHGLPALDEAQAKQVLAAYGVPVPAGGLSRSPAEAVDLAAKLGGAVAMKASGVLIRHKTDSGLVLLDLRSADEVAEAYATLAARAGDALQSVLVEEMVSGSREFMVGMKRDAAFGPVVAFGLGGTMTEVFHDVALAILPVVEGDIEELLDLIHARNLLGVFRGQPAVDRGAIATIVQAVARIAADHPEIAEIDVNPLLIDGDRPVAADALVMLSSGASAGRPQSRLHARIWRPCSPRVRSPSSALRATCPAGADPRCRISSLADSRATSTL